MTITNRAIAEHFIRRLELVAAKGYIRSINPWYVHADSQLEVVVDRITPDSVRAIQGQGFYIMGIEPSETKPEYLVLRLILKHDDERNLPLLKIMGARH